MEKYSFKDFKKIKVKSGEYVNIIAISTGEGVEEKALEVYHPMEYDQMQRNATLGYEDYPCNMLVLLKRLLKLPSNTEASLSLYTFVSNIGEDISQLKSDIEIKGTFDGEAFVVDINNPFFARKDNAIRNKRIVEDQIGLSEFREFMEGVGVLGPYCYTEDDLPEYKLDPNTYTYVFKFTLGTEPEKKWYEIYPMKDYVYKSGAGQLFAETGDRSVINYMLKRICELGFETEMVMNYTKYIGTTCIKPDASPNLEIKGLYNWGGNFKVEIYSDILSLIKRSQSQKNE